MVKVIGHGDSAIREFAIKCSEAGGVPIFQTKYGGKPLDEILGRKHNLTPHIIIAKCWGASDKAPGGVIDGVSESLYRMIEQTKGEWKQLVGKV